MPVVFGYWNIRGLAQPIRLLLVYTGTEFEEKRYVAKFDGTTYDIGEWKSDKFNLGLDFPNLPYYIDDDIKLTESSAIIKYIAGKHGLCGDSNKDKATLDMLQHVIIDYRTAFSTLCYRSSFDEKAVSEYKEKAKNSCKSLDSYLGEKKYMLGEKLSFVDFLLYDYLDGQRIFDPALLGECKNLMNFATRFEALPAIAAYKQSDKYIERPLNGPSAKFK